MGISDRSARRRHSAPGAGLAGRVSAKAKIGMLGGGIAAVAAGALAVTTLTGGGSSVAALAASSKPAAGAAGGYQFVELGSHQDRTFNQLLGINNVGHIVGYFGSGDAGHPNKGYEISAPYAQNYFQHENFPGSAQTQITGLNDTGIEVGFYSTQNGKTPADDNNFAFWRSHGRYHQVNYPTGNNSNPPVNQLLGVNDTDTAVGFYNDSAGNAHGYAYNIGNGRFKPITVPGATSLTATAINNEGSAAGFYTNKAGTTVGFLQTHHGRTYTIAVPGASATNVFGVNDNNWVVGTYTVGTGNNAVTHGFVDIIGGRLLTSFDDPNGAGGTFLNGINDENDIVGFYVDAAGNTDGLLAFPPF